MPPVSSSTPGGRRTLPSRIIYRDPPPQLCGVRARRATRGRGRERLAERRRSVVGERGRVPGTRSSAPSSVGSTSPPLRSAAQMPARTAARSNGDAGTTGERSRLSVLNSLDARKRDRRIAKSSTYARSRAAAAAGEGALGNSAGPIMRRTSLPIERKRQVVFHAHETRVRTGAAGSGSEVEDADCVTEVPPDAPPRALGGTVSTTVVR